MEIVVPNSKYRQCVAVKKSKIYASVANRSHLSMDQGRREATECDEPSDRKCPLWIKSGHRIRSASCPRFPESGHRFNALGCPLSAKSRSGARRHPVRLGWGKPVRSSCPASNSGLILTVCAMSSLAPNAIRSTRLLGCNSSPLYRRVAKRASPAFPRAN